MLRKKVSNKVYAVVLILAITLLSSICFGSLQWSYLIDCSNSLNKTQTTFGRQALECYASTMVEPFDRAGLIILLQTIDEEGDWVTVTGWTDYNKAIATLDEVYAVSDGTYRMSLQHTAFAEDDTDYSDPLELFHVYSDERTYP